MDAIAPAGKVSTWLARFSSALESKDIDAIKALFGADCYLRHSFSSS